MQWRCHTAVRLKTVPSVVRCMTMCSTIFNEYITIHWLFSVHYVCAVFMARVNSKFFKVYFAPIYIYDMSFKPVGTTRFWLFSSAYKCTSRSRYIIFRHCSSNVAHATTLSNHMYIHATSPPVSCPQCRLVFATLDACRLHRQEAHGNIHASGQHSECMSLFV